MEITSRKSRFVACASGYAASTVLNRRQAGRNAMDPNNPGQNSGAPTPDPWAQPQSPEQPQTPAQPQTPEQPQVPGQEPAGQPSYGAPPAQPQGWGAPAPGYDPGQQQFGQQQYPPQQPYGGQQQYPPQQPYGGQQQYPPQQPYGGQEQYPPQQPYGGQEQYPPQQPYPGQEQYPPQQPYPGQPWGGAPVPQQKSRLPRIIGVIAVIVVALIALVVVSSLLSPSYAGQVVFTSDAPTSEGAKTCQLGTKVTSVKLGDPVYANIFFKDRLSNETVTLTIYKDGTKLDSIPYGDTEVNGVDCIEDSSNLGDIFTSYGAGSYEFKLTDSHGNVVSDGTLTVTQ
jgi:hypothetical protein